MTALPNTRDLMGLGVPAPLATYLINNFYPASVGLNVKLKGALGDGATDDATAIQSAISSAVTLGINAIFFPPGTYIVRATLKVPSNFSLVGAGRGISIIKLGNAANVDIIQNSNVVLSASNVASTSASQGNITLRQLTLDGNKDNQTTYAGTLTLKRGIFLFQAFDLVLAQVEVKNVAGTDILINGNAQKEGPAFVSDVWVSGAQANGYQISSGFRYAKHTDLLAYQCLNKGAFFDVSQCQAENIYAQENGNGTSNAFANIGINNLTGGTYNNLVASCGYGHGIEVTGMRHSTGSGWNAYQNGLRTNNTYDDIHFGPNPDAAGYGENEDIIISAVRAGDNTQLQLGTAFATGKSRYALYFGDESNTNMRIDVVYGGAVTANLRPPASPGTLYVNGALTP